MGPESGGGMYSEVQCIMGNDHVGFPLKEWQTDMIENITFPQLLWQAEIKYFY